MTSPDFTGERFIPGQGGAQIAYEHMHRYQFALRFAAGNRVLDVATGIGYGAGLLARAAESVWAVDLDAASVQYARRVFPVDNLMFVQGNASCLPLHSHSVDLVIAFEVLEHVADQEGLVAELARVARPGGTVLISTPNKASYSDARNYSNPFHVHEFYREEFVALLGRHFDSIQLVQQQVRAGSLILNEEPGAGNAEVTAEAVGGSISVAAMYFLAFCRAGKRLKTIPAASAYLDTGDGLLLEWEQRLQAAGVELKRLNFEVDKMGLWSRKLEEELEARDGSIRALQAEVETLSQWGRELQDTLAARDGTIADLQDTMQREVSSRDQAIQEIQDTMQREVSSRDQAIQEIQDTMQREVSSRDQAIQGLQDAMQQEIALRDKNLEQLQSRLEMELEARDQALSTLQGEFDERSRWAQELEQGVANRDERIKQRMAEFDRLRGEFDERGRWAQQLECEVSARDATIRKTLGELDRIAAQLADIKSRRTYRVLSRMRILPV
jgi:O-antigen biosynthesis protein